jgi:hypothetical protein
MRAASFILSAIASALSFYTAYDVFKFAWQIHDLNTAGLMHDQNITGLYEVCVRAIGVIFVGIIGIAGGILALLKKKGSVLFWISMFFCWVLWKNITFRGLVMLYFISGILSTLSERKPNEQSSNEAKFRMGSFMAKNWGKITLITAISTAAITMALVLFAKPARQIVDIIQFGGYNWRALDVQNGHALILSENVMEKKAYHKEYKAVTWETCDLRAYLNEEFINQFSAEDKARIAETRVTTNDNPCMAQRAAAIQATGYFC